MSRTTPLALPPRVDVLIAGAGPAGSGLASHLARAGLDVLVVDRARFPRDKPCSEYMSPETVRLLDRFGIVPALEAAGAHPLRGTTVTASGGARLSGEFARLTTPAWRSTGLSVARRILDAELVHAARRAGALVVEGVSVVELIENGGEVQGAKLRGEDGAHHEVRARITVGADGLRSVVARRAGRRTLGTPSRMAFVAHVEDVSGLGGSAELHVGPEGYAGLNPIGGGVTNVALVVPAHRATLAGGRVADFFFAALDDLPGVRGRISPDRVVREILVTGPFAARTRPVVRDGALLVGDAADFFDPFTGEGIYRALRGAELAAECLIPLFERSERITARHLATYAAQRRQEFLGTWGVERLIGYAMLWPALFNHAVRRLGQRAGMADTLIGVTGDCLPAAAVLNPVFLARMLL